MMKRMRRWCGRVGWVFLLAGIGRAAADPGYQLKWFSVDGGGGVARGGPYVLQGCAGQPEGVLEDKRKLAVTGGLLLAAGGLDDVYLAPGYLPGVVAMLASPALAIRREGLTGVVLSWQALPLDFAVLGTTNLGSGGDGWSLVTGEKSVAGEDWEMNLRLLGEGRYFLLVPDWWRKN